MSIGEWKKYKLSELVNIIGGGTPKTSVPEYWDGDIPWLSVVDFGGGNKYVFDTQKKITSEGLKNSSTRILKEGQLIISARGTVGEIAMLKKDMAFNQSCYGLNANENTINDFLYYLIKQNLVELKNKTHGAVFDTITKETFNHIQVSIPPKTTQKKIASILSSLDDKIELNRQTNQTLEAIAHTLFKEMFLENVDESLMEISFGELVKPQKGKNITKSNAVFGSIPVVAGGLEPSCFHNESNTKAPVVTISSSGANAGFVRLYQTPVWSSDSCYIDSTIYLYVYFCYIFLKINQKKIYNSQEGSAQPHIYPRHIMALSLLNYDKKLIESFNNLVQPLFEKILQNEQESQTLSTLRDSFLPKLMKGEIKFKS